MFIFRQIIVTLRVYCTTTHLKTPFWGLQDLFFTIIFIKLGNFPVSNYPKYSPNIICAFSWHRHIISRVIQLRKNGKFGLNCVSIKQNYVIQSFCYPPPQKKNPNKKWHILKPIRLVQYIRIYLPILNLSSI